MQISRISLHGIWQQVFRQRQRQSMPLPWFKSNFRLWVEWKGNKRPEKASIECGSPSLRVFIHSLTLANMKAGKCLTYACACYSGHHLAWDLCILTAWQVFKHTHTHNLNCHWLPLNPELAPLLRISSLGETSMEQGNCLFLWVCYQGSRHSHALRNTDLCSPHSPAAPETRNSKRTVIICIWPERRQWKLRGSGHGNVQVRIWTRQGQQALRSRLSGEEPPW